MRPLKITLFTLLLASCATSPAGSPGKIPPPPATASEPAAETLHDVDITDPYPWLDKQTSQQTRAWIEQQNAYTDEVLGKRKEATMFAPRLTELMRTDQLEVPEFRNGRYFYRRRPAGSTLHSIYMREGLHGQDQLLVDAATLTVDHSANVKIEDVSKDGSIVAYSLRRPDEEQAEIRFFNVNERKEVGRLPAGRYYSIDLMIDQRPGVFFTRVTQKGMRLFYRDVEGRRESELFGNQLDPRTVFVTSISDDGRSMLIHLYEAAHPNKTTILVEDLTDSDPFQIAINDLDVRSTAIAAGDKLIIQTNWDAPNDRIMITDIRRPNRANWKELIPSKPNALIQETAVAGGRIWVRYLENVKPRIVGYDLEGRQQEVIELETAGEVQTMSGSWGRPFLFFSFSSFAIPQTIYQFDVAKNERTEFARVQAPVKSADFALEQLWFPSKDGTRVPMYVFYKKGLQKNGAHPTYLTAYGGFLLSELPAYSPRAIAWAERGGVYALANVRGGGELGTEWHRGGMLAQKQNTFDDFAAAAQFLIAERYTSSQHLAAGGVGNGGLVAAVLATQHPDLAAAIASRYPLIDMVRYPRYLAGRDWVPEFGDPNNEAAFRALYAYSPYHHVTKGTNYPATLFITGDSETRIAPLHARKMTALMQSANASGKPILLRYAIAADREALGEQVRSLAEELGFLWGWVR
ncbi:MAG TPA: prolyl oligopeptidase family serine peptidase [Thermoanaerobaculia bacterium]|nr:prolyl oligopeptidase family serine peptidase [Thermoanaerobaculia bacterium]